MTMALAETAAVHKICPLPSELSFINKNIPCPEEGCGSTFLSSSNLEMHLSKHHKKRSDGLNKRDHLNKMNCQYHCPVGSCLYNINSDRHFTHIKYLKQHYLKVHAEKKFLCKKCDKGFSTEAACNVHTRICGMKFTCSCGCNYMSYEALITHAKRKNHTFDVNLKLCAKGQAAPRALQPSNVISQDALPADVSMEVPPKAPIILALGSSAVAPVPIAVKPLGPLLPSSSAVDVGVQTDRSSGGRRATGGGRRSSAQTQTWSVKRSKICAGTQTQGDYILKRAMRAAQIPVEGEVRSASGRKRKKSMETQTQGEDDGRGQPHRRPPVLPIPSTSSQQQQQQTCVYDNSLPWPIPDAYPKCSSSTQTNPPVISQPVVTQTTDDLFQESLNQYLCSQEEKQPPPPPPPLVDSPPCSPPRFDPMLLSVPSKEESLGGHEEDDEALSRALSRPAETQTESLDPTLSHIETQTNTEDFLLFEQLLHANMCTQTCEDTSLFSELGFSDIQTQTQDEATRTSLWRDDDPSSSMSWCPMLVSAETQTAGHSTCLSETSHMETQTDVDELIRDVDELRSLIVELTKHDIEGE
ncbi:uncharacterized protein LOC124163795 [Ischnura elegans]|uniref:uncharacterized protein LOC124163795 n=1 Tax=Ischnura elegans TaxID=197161 RepID=UPI001ED8764A|nr:uncharacterized protein LOC124163795 [Ischnura elegans]